MSGEIKLMATGYCEKCKFKDLELTTFETWADDSGCFYEIHCKHEEICREWNEKFESLKRAFDSQVLKQTHCVTEEDLKKLHEYLDVGVKERVRTEH